MDIKLAYRVEISMVNIAHGLHLNVLFVCAYVATYRGRIMQ